MVTKEKRSDAHDDAGSYGHDSNVLVCQPVLIQFKSQDTRRQLPNTRFGSNSSCIVEPLRRAFFPTSPALGS